jgi:hypothetical protein
LGKKKEGIGRPNRTDMGFSKNGGTPKSSILIGFSIINHPFLGDPNLWKPHYGTLEKTTTP